MADRAVGAVGAGLVATGSYVCWLGWTAGDGFALFAGALGVGLGGTMCYRGLQPRRDR